MYKLFFFKFFFQNHSELIDNKFRISYTENFENKATKIKMVLEFEKKSTSLNTNNFERSLVAASFNLLQSQ